MLVKCDLSAEADQQISRSVDQGKLRFSQKFKNHMDLIKPAIMMPGV